MMIPLSESPLHIADPVWMLLLTYFYTWTTAYNLSRRCTSLYFRRSIPYKAATMFLCLNLFNGFQVAFRPNFKMVRQVYKFLYCLLLSSDFTFLYISPGSFHFDLLWKKPSSFPSQGLGVRCSPFPESSPFSLSFPYPSSLQLLNVILWEKPSKSLTFLPFSHPSYPFLIPCSLIFLTVCTFLH